MLPQLSDLSGSLYYPFQVKAFNISKWYHLQIRDSDGSFCSKKSPNPTAGGGIAVSSFQAMRSFFFSSKVQLAIRSGLL